MMKDTKRVNRRAAPKVGGGATAATHPTASLSKLSLYAAFAAAGLIGVAVGLAIRTHECPHGRTSLSAGRLEHLHVDAPPANPAHPLLRRARSANPEPRNQAARNTNSASIAVNSETSRRVARGRPSHPRAPARPAATAGAAQASPSPASTSPPTQGDVKPGPQGSRQQLVRSAQVSAKMAALIRDYHTYISPIRSVLTADGERLIGEAFTSPVSPTPFRIEIETVCREDLPGTYNASTWLEMCQSTDRGFLTDQQAHRQYCIGTDNAEVWCIKHGAEFAIPHILAKSPWAAAAGATPNVSLVQMHGKCKGNENEQHLHCDHRIGKKFPGDRAAWRRPENAWYVVTDDFGKCDIHGDMDPSTKTWKAPLLSINGERWSASKSAPCTNQRRDVIVPTTNMIIPSTEGNLLAAAAKRAENAPRETLAFMLRGRRYTARNQVVRLWSGDKDMKIVEAAPHEDSIEMMLGSKFCVQADGQAPWSPRLVEYIALGCVPVLLSDTLLPPFQRTLDWATFSVQLQQRDAADLKLILTRLVEQGHYARLKANLLVVADLFRYYLDHPTRGATPLIVAEMMAVAKDTDAVKALPPPPSVEWKPQKCHFLEDCPGGCGGERGKKRPDVIPFPCDPVVFSDCVRVKRGEPEKRGLAGIDFVWGEPMGPNVTLCATKGRGYAPN